MHLATPTFRRLWTDYLWLVNVPFFKRTDILLPNTSSKVGGALPSTNCLLRVHINMLAGNGQGVGFFVRPMNKIKLFGLCQPELTGGFNRLKAEWVLAWSFFIGLVRLILQRWIPSYIWQELATPCCLQCYKIMPAGHLLKGLFQSGSSEVGTKMLLSQVFNSM